MHVTVCAVSPARCGTLDSVPGRAAPVWPTRLGTDGSAGDLKVLWFTNIELPAVQRRLAADVTGGAWMEGLRTALRAEGGVQLGMAARGTVPFEPFVEDGVRYYHLHTPLMPSGVAGVARRWRHLTHDESLLAQALSVIDRFRPDLIHVHGSEGPFGLLWGAVPTPVLISLQGILAACSRAYFAGIPATDLVRDVLSLEFAKGRGLVHTHGAMRMAAGRELVILKGCRFFAGRTDWDRAILSAVNPGARYYHAEEVLRPEFYHHLWRPLAGSRFVVYTTGGPAPYKGLVLLLEAVALLRESVRPDIQLRIAGEVEGTAMWPIALRAVDRLGLRGVVRWLGPLSSAAVVSELEAASVYVHPSFVENSPNSVAEAMILGVPCVAACVGGVPSLLKDGREGLLFRPGDVRGLAEMIGVLAAEPALATRLGGNARRRALRRHDPRAIAPATIDMYGDILMRHRAGKQ